MANLGEFGTPREASEDAFGYFGHVIGVHPDMSDVVLLDFAQRAVAITAQSEAASSIRVVMDLLRSLIHPDDFEEFWGTAKANRQTVDDLLEVVVGLVEAVTNRPTKRPSSSSSGQPHTTERSGGASSSPVVERLERQGRPDLALMVTRAQEFRASA